MRALAALVLLALTAGALALAALPWLAESPAAAPAPRQVAEPPALPAAPKPTEATEFAPLAERPLFSAARRPPPPEAPGEPIEDPMAQFLFSRYQIAGVVLMGEKTIAMLRDMRDGGLIRIRAGDRIDEAEVVDITLEALTFRQGDATVVAPISGGAAGER